MGNCLRRSEGDQQDYSLLGGQQEHRDSVDRSVRLMGNVQQGNSAASASASSSTHSGSSFAGVSSRASQDLRDSSPESGSNYTALVERGVPSEEDQMKLAQRYGLIQHLPTGLYDGGKKDRECPICMVELSMNDPVRFLPCMHVFHKDCIDDWLLKHSLTCPNCMEPVDSALLNSYEVGKTPWNYES